MSMEFGPLGAIFGSPRSGDATAENALKKQLQMQAYGNGPSMADQQGQLMSQRLGAQQQSMAAGAGPGQSAMAYRLAAQNTGNGQAQIAQQTQMARLQEKQNAQNQLAQWLQYQRSAELADDQRMSPFQKMLGAGSGVATGFGGMG